MCEILCLHSYRIFDLRSQNFTMTKYYCVIRLFTICQNHSGRRRNDRLREPSANGSTDDLSWRYYQSYHVRTCRILGITGNDFHGVSPAKDGINMASRSASVTFRMVNEIVAPAASNRRARRRSKRSSKPSFPSMEWGLVGVTMTDCDPDSIEESR